MKKILTLLLAFMFLMAFSVTAFAQNDISNNIVITPSTQTVEVGQPAYLTATTTANGESTWYFLNDSWNSDGGTVVETLTPSATDSNVTISKASFTALDAGTYTITYSITVSSTDTSNNEFTGSATASVVVGTQTIVVENPAAPSVAAHLLKDAGINPKYRTGNYISDVALHMGPSTYFDGYSKDDVVNYRNAVAAFLNIELKKQVIPFINTAN